MTWSIVARDADGSFGVAIASRFFAVATSVECIWDRQGSGSNVAAGASAPRMQHWGLTPLLRRVRRNPAQRAGTAARPPRSRVHMFHAPDARSDGEDRVLRRRTPNATTPP